MGVLQSFNMVLIRSLEASAREMAEMETKFKFEIKDMKSQKAILDKREAEINQKQNMIKSLLKGKDFEIQQLKVTEQQQTQQIEHLNKMLEE